MRIRAIFEAHQHQHLCAKRGAVEIGIWRPHVEDARLKQRLRRRYRNLVVDEMRNAAGTRTRNERFAERFEGCDLLGVERAERDVLRPCLPRCQKNLGAPPP